MEHMRLTSIYNQQKNQLIRSCLTLLRNYTEKIYLEERALVRDIRMCLYALHSVLDQAHLQKLEKSLLDLKLYLDRYDKGTDVHNLRLQIDLLTSDLELIIVESAESLPEEDSELVTLNEIEKLKIPRLIVHQLGQMTP